MTASVADLQRGATEIVRAAVQSGEEVVLTDSGKAVAKIVPLLRTVTVSAENARAGGELTDAAILAAVREARDDDFDRLGQ